MAVSFAYLGTPAAAVAHGKPADDATDKPTMKYVGAAATDVMRSLKEGNGWCLVSAREKREVIPGEPAVDCVRYRVVTKFAVSKIPDRNGGTEDVVEITLGEPTDWIALDLKMPKTSGSSLAAAKAANEAVTGLDLAITLLEGGLAMETDAKVRAEVAKGIAALKKQRTALADLIAKDVAAIGSLYK
jgi:hypothetical protein